MVLQKLLLLLMEKDHRTQVTKSQKTTRMEEKETNVIKENDSFSPENMPSTIKKQENEEKSLQGKTIEIERKFLIPEDCEDKLLKMGCRFGKQEEFTDHYYDTDDYQLTLGDRWLRNRSGTWQMKYSLPELQHNHATRYCETETESEILALLSRFTSRTADNVQDFVRANCQPIAVLRTLRKCYSCDNVTIVLDITDFGFTVGEIEVVVREGQSLAEGLKAVDDLASKLGFISFAAYDIASLMPDRSV